jgi:hypothetical protein
MYINKKRMKEYIKITLFILSCFWTDQAFAQKQTEVYIPIGQSPGISGIHSVTDTIGSINTEGSLILLVLKNSSDTIKVDSTTSIYLDNSAGNVPNKQGQLAHLKTGMLIEVKYKENDPGNVAEWIKIRNETGRRPAAE